MGFEASLAAKLLIETGAMSAPVDLSKVTHAKGILVKEDDCEGYSGMLVVVNDKALISVKKSVRESGRKRYTIAHELGHYVLPDHITKDNKVFRCSDDQLNAFGKNKTKEVEANIFASELLMPEQLFKPRVLNDDITKKLIRELTEEFQTSLTATCIRMVNCRAEYSLVCSEDSRVKWFCRGEEFPYYLNTTPGSPLHQDSFAAHFFETSKTNENFYEVPLEAWIDDRRARSSAVLKETVIGIPSYNAALSILFVDQNGAAFNEDAEEDAELDGSLKFRK